MKIAAVSDDGATISQHFGRATSYVVVTVEDEKVVSTETRSKLGHHSFSSQESPHVHGESQGHGEGAHMRHSAMMEAIQDCQALLSRGMGWGAFEALRERGIDAVITDVANIDEAALLYAKGQLPNLRDRLH